jgi:hypothetical protein
MKLSIHCKSMNCSIHISCLKHVYYSSRFVHRQSTIVMLYTYASLLMLLIRPLLSIVINRKYIAATIYSALHFYPCLLVLHALFGGLICKLESMNIFIYVLYSFKDFSFPILTISSGVLLNAIHFTLVANGEHQWFPFVRKLCGNIKNWIIYLIHVLILLCGLISLTQFEHDYHFILLATIFVPAVLYILLYKFTATSPIRSTNA